MMARFLGVCLIFWMAVADAAPVLDAGCPGPVPSDAAPGVETPASDALFEWRASPDGTFRKALLPLFAWERDARGRDMFDILWPVGTISRWDRTTTWRFLTAFGYDYDNQDPHAAYRVWVFPFLFWGRNAEGETYRALFPLGGHIDGFMGRDMRFVLFPLYAHSRFKDLETHHVLWPIVSVTTGAKIRQFRVFPVYGRSTKKDAWTKQFVLWPFWNSARYEYPGGRGYGYVLFPLFGHVKVAQQETWMVVPPLFRHTVGPAGRDGYYPWPFLQISAGKVDKLYVWPLYGQRTEGAMRKQFWLWPFVWRHHDVAGAVAEDRFRLFPLFYTRADRRMGAVTNVAARYTSVWPLVSYARQEDGACRVRMLDLWPFGDTLPVERTLAPLWTLYRYERNGSGTENSLLWGIVQWRHRDDGIRSGSVCLLASWAYDPGADTQRAWSFMKGLIGYRRDEHGREFRLLYGLHWRTEP